MIIDAHIHPSPEDVADGGARLLAALDAAGIDLAVASDLGDWSDFPASAVVREANRRMRAMAARHAPRLRYLVYLNPLLPDWEAELAEHAKTAIGVKLWISLRDKKGSLAPARAALARVSALGLPALLHVYHRTGGPRPGEIDLDDFDALCREFPECAMIGAHAGGNWREALGRLRGLPANKYYDISGGYPERGMVERLVGGIGAERILFGSDASARSFASQLAKVAHANLLPEDRELILWRNACRVFRLEDAPLQAAARRRAGAAVRASARFPWPAWGEDHFCFCGRWPLADIAIEPGELAAELAGHGVRRGFAANLADMLQTDLPRRNRDFAAACRAHPEIVPLASVDPRRREALTQLDAMDGFAGVWLSPYLHNYAVDDPALAPFWRRCSELGVAAWINTSLSDWRFRSPSLAARPVPAAELENFLRGAPENDYTIQAWPGLADACGWGGAGRRRFELSRLSDSEYAAENFFSGRDGSALVWGSEYPFRDFPQVRDCLWGKNHDGIERVLPGKT